MVLKALIKIYDINTLQLKLSFPYATDITVVRDRNEFTDTCQVVIPQRTRRVNQKISDLVNIGDPIEVFMGWAPNIYREFTGYVSNIKPDSPMLLECEDLAFKYKNNIIGADYVLKDTTFNELIGTLYDGNYLTTNDKIGTWEISKNATLIDVLDSLKNTFGVPSYWQNNTLYVAYEFNKEPENTILFDVQQNVPLGSNQLNVNSQTNLSIISHGVSEQKNGTTIEAFAYYENTSGKRIKVTTTRPPGILNTFKQPNLTLVDLRELVKKRLPRLYYAGVTGEIAGKTPSFNHGDRVAVRDTRNPDVNGIYDVPKVVKRFGVGVGYTHMPTLGIKVADFS